MHTNQNFRIVSPRYFIVWYFLYFFYFANYLYYIIIRELIFEVETFFISLYYILSHFSYSYLFITNLFRKFNTSITGDIDTSNFIHIRLKNVTFFFFFDNGICNVLNYFFILFISFFSRIIIFIFCMLRNLIERTYLELEQKYYTRINEACWVIISPNHDTSCIQTRGKIEIDN